MDDQILKVVKSQKDIKTQLGLSIEAPVELSDKTYSVTLREVAQNVDLPGFRKGKAPKEVIEKHFGVGYISQKAFEKAFYNLLNQVAIKEKLDIVDVIEITSFELIPGKPLTFNVIVELKPEVKLGKYKNLKISAKKIIYDKQEFINKTLEKLANNFITFKKSIEGTVNEGDLVIIDFEGKFEDDSEVPGGKAENFQAILEKDKFLPDFVEKLKGTKIGETTNISVKFPDNSKEDFAGKTANFKVLIKEVEEKILPEINDDFAKRFGLEDLNELQNKIVTQMVDLQENTSMREFENRIVDKIVSDTKFEISENLIQKEIDFILQDVRHQCESNKINWNNFKNHDKNKELIEKARESAQKRISIDLVLNAIANKETIQVSNEEIDNDIRARISQMGDKYRHLESDKSFRKSVQAVLLRNKTLDFLIKHNEPIWEEEVTKQLGF